MVAGRYQGNAGLPLRNGPGRSPARTTKTLNHLTWKSSLSIDGAGRGLDLRIKPALATVGTAPDGQSPAIRTAGWCRYGSGPDARVAHVSVTVVIDLEPLSRQARPDGAGFDTTGLVASGGIAAGLELEPTSAGIVGFGMSHGKAQAKTRQNCEDEKNCPDFHRPFPCSFGCFARHDRHDQRFSDPEWGHNVTFVSPRGDLANRLGIRTSPLFHKPHTELPEWLNT